MAGNKPTLAGKISNHGAQVVKAIVSPAGKTTSGKVKTGNDLRSK